MSVMGSCLCGSVRYEVDGPLEQVGNCHCSMCRKSHGAAFVTWAIIQPEHFHWVAGVDHIQHYVSSPGRTRCFCRECGSPLAGTHNGAVGEVVMASIDGDPGVLPSDHIFVGSKAPWHVITDSLPQHDEWPPGFAP